MTLYYYVRIRFGWSEKFQQEAAPAEVKAWRETDAQIRASYATPRGTPEHLTERFEKTPIGTKVYGGCAGTLTELSLAGCDIDPKMILAVGDP